MAARVTAKPCTCLHGRRLIVLTARAFSSILNARQELYARYLAYMFHSLWPRWIFIAYTVSHIEEPASSGLMKSEAECGGK